jgi:hypothetical protein
LSLSLNEDENILDKIQIFFSQKIEVDLLNFAKCLILRRDGIIIFSSDKSKNDWQSFAGVVGGVWQGLSVLAPLINWQGNLEQVVLDLDLNNSRSNGILLAPINIKGQELVSVFLYSEIINKGKIIYRIKKCVHQLTNYLNQNLNLNLSLNQNQNQNQNKSEKDSFRKTSSNKVPPLFINITDNEIDQLFSFVDETKRTTQCPL